ncbi:hypothetical protein DNTS_017877 [Danionella cerebrum]|uniref:CRIB domain-containing protein n=1 Tax=Danionella cerebrum TaxID=2873325 RepID=A0A553N225_9TELE|nr:hypothetical protein DNTS_017877 [Danionella translucida]
MPLHKSSRAPRLDPTMISAPLGDFRHTMHIGRGGDAFGDTSFLSSHGPSSPSSKPVTESIETKDAALNHHEEITYTEKSNTSELRHSDSVSSFDLDLDLGPSILGDVLGVMDGLTMGSSKDSDEVFSTTKDMMAQRSSERMGSFTKEGSQRDEQMNEVNGMRSKGLRPKVRFSDKRDEIITQQEVITRMNVDIQEETSLRPDKGLQEVTSRTAFAEEARQAEMVNQREESSPSLTSTSSSEYEGVSRSERRREDQHLSECDSEEEAANGEQGYTFEDESDDEIGL